MTRPNFWTGAHPLTTTQRELFDKLVPVNGAAETLQGELLHAANKISYDWYNNGWGCNNWSGAVVFLRDSINLLPNRISVGELIRLNGALRFANNYSHGEQTFGLADREAANTVTDIMEIVVQAIINNPEPIVNIDDMYNHSEPDYQGHDDEDYDEDYDED
jgi:hypothetical protein